MKNSSKRRLFLRYIGFAFILLGIILNEWLLAALFSKDGLLLLSTKILIWTFDISFILFGILFVTPPSKKSLKANIILLYFSVIFCFLVFELFLQITDKPKIDYLNRKGATIYLVSKNFHHDYRPSQIFLRYPKKYDEFLPVENQINSLGIRGTEIPAKRDGEYRILLLGDSFMQADEIKYEDTVGQVLSKIINKKDCLVIQHGMSSWSPLLELNWFNKKGIKLKPNLAILFLCINDFYSASTADIGYIKQTVFDEKGLPLKFNVNVPAHQNITKPKRKTNRFAIELKSIKLISSFFHQLKEKAPSFSQETIDFLLNNDFDNFRKSAIKLIPPNFKEKAIILNILELSRPSNLWDKETTERVNISFGFLDKLHDIAKRENINIAISLVPLPWNVSKTETKIGRKKYLFTDVILPMGGIEKKIKEYCKTNDIHYIDLYTSFINYLKGSKKKLFLISDGHWTAKGHEIAAKTIKTSLNL